MTDIDAYLASYASHQKILAEANAVNKSAVFDALSEAGITNVTVNFNGEGDSGQIEDISVTANGEQRQLPDIRVEIQQVAWGALKMESHETALSDAIEELCYDYLSQEHGGWENNDGAFGDFTFEIAERRINLDFNGRYSDFTTTSHTF
jgi:hypothetical protein